MTTTQGTQTQDAKAPETTSATSTSSTPSWLQGGGGAVATAQALINEMISKYSELVEDKVEQEVQSIGTQLAASLDEKTATEKSGSEAFTYACISAGTSLGMAVVGAGLEYKMTQCGPKVAADEAELQTAQDQATNLEGIHEANKSPTDGGLKAGDSAKHGPETDIGHRKAQLLNNEWNPEGARTNLDKDAIGDMTPNERAVFRQEYSKDLDRQTDIIHNLGRNSQNRMQSAQLWKGAIQQTGTSVSRAIDGAGQMQTKKQDAIAAIDRQSASFAGSAGDKAGRDRQNAAQSISQQLQILASIRQSRKS